MTLEEITQREEELMREIAEKQQLLAAYRLIRSDHALPPGTAVPLAPAPAMVPGLEHRAPHSLAPVPRQVPIPPPMNPVLAAFGKGHGRSGRLVAWAIRQMTTDYTLHEIAAVLRREGAPISLAKISVVLTRLNKGGQIEQIGRGTGRTASVFRNPAPRTDQEPATAETTIGTDSPAGSTARG